MLPFGVRLLPVRASGVAIVSVSAAVAVDASRVLLLTSSLVITSSIIILFAEWSNPIDVGAAFILDGPPVVAAAGVLHGGCLRRNRTYIVYIIISLLSFMRHVGWVLLSVAVCVGGCADVENKQSIFAKMPRPHAPSGRKCSRCGARSRPALGLPPGLHRPLIQGAGGDSDLLLLLPLLLDKPPLRPPPSPPPRG